MNLKAPLRFDLNGLFAPLLNDGIKDLDVLNPLFESVHSGVKALRATGQLGFATLPTDIRMQSEILDLAARYRDVDHVVVFGIGGSALGAKSLDLALRGVLGAFVGPRLHVIDNVDPDTHLNLRHTLENQKFLYVVISKSGNTSETLAQILFAKRHLPSFDKDHVVVITDQTSGALRDFATQGEYPTLPVPHNVGGRFSVFSAVGLFPLAVCGHDIEALLEGARHAEQQAHSNVLAQNPAALMACALHTWFKDHGLRELVVMPYADRLLLFADWAAQLVAESLNKRHTLSGSAPTYSVTLMKALGTTDQHSQLQLYLDGARDKAVLFLSVARERSAALHQTPWGDDRADFLVNRSLNDLLAAERTATEAALWESSRPTLDLQMAMVNSYQLGQLYQTFMNLVPYWGALLDINPYDQPAVEAIKKYTFGLMGKAGFGDVAEKIKAKPVSAEFVF